MEVLKDNKSMFGVNFDENKKALNKISTITSKILKNELAGYITKFILTNSNTAPGLPFIQMKSKV